MADDRAVADLESFLAERGEPLLRTAVLLKVAVPAGFRQVPAPVAPAAHAR